MYEVYTKGLETEVVFTKTEIKNELSINYFQNSHFYIKKPLIPVSISLAKAPLKLLFWYEMKLCSCISLMSMHTWNNFLVQVIRKIHMVMTMVGVAPAKSYIFSKAADEKIERLKDCWFRSIGNWHWLM